VGHFGGESATEILTDDAAQFVGYGAGLVFEIGRRCGKERMKR
jgi:hypothetical protein